MILDILVWCAVILSVLAMVQYAVINVFRPYRQRRNNAAENKQPGDSDEDSHTADAES